MNEVVRIESWIYSRLTGDTGTGGLNTLVNGRIYAYMAKQGASYPLVIYQLQAGNDTQGLGTNRVMTRAQYLVKVISNGAPTAAAKSAADRIDVLLTVAASVKDGYVFSGRRENPFSMVETDETLNATFWHVGGLYRIECYTS